MQNNNKFIDESGWGSQTKWVGQSYENSGPFHSSVIFVVEREDFKPPSFETISNTLNGCKVFSVVEMSNCYWHQKLTEKSSFLCTFNSPFGRYRFKRMPFGISSASEVAQKMVEKHFGDLAGALPVFEDIIIGGKNEQEHDLILRKVLTRARERNIKFNRDKIQFHVN